MINAVNFYNNHLPVYEVRVHDKGVQRLTSALAQPYHPSNVTMAYGKLSSISDRDLNAINAKRHSVKGDGSCWARATWMCVLSQVLSDPQKFHHFMIRVAESPETLNVPEQYAISTLQIMDRLNQMSLEERINFLNHENVDRDLIFFMRHVSGEMMSRFASIYSPQDIHDIKTNINRYGGPESTFFARYANLELHLVRKQGNKWVYQKKEADKNFYEHAVNLDQFPQIFSPLMCLFGVNDAHFEFLSF